MRVLFGAGLAASAIDELRTLGATRVVVITTPGRAQHAPPGVRTLAIAEPQVPQSVVNAALKQLGDADAILSIGGGTATGLGKAVAYHRDVVFGAVPTTYAGSEMTDIWATSNNAGKTTLRDPRVRPQLVIYDAELTLNFPVATTVTSALNAMAHPVDASWNGADDELAAACSRAIEGWMDTLPQLVAKPKDLELREAALRAAQDSGIALHRGTMGLQHKLVHVLGGTHGLPHADTHAVLLPHVIAYNQKHTDLDPTALYTLMQNIGAPTQLAKAVPVNDVVSEVMRAPYPNPEPMDASRLTKLVEHAMKGLPPQ